MVFIFSLDLILTFFTILCVLGIGWAIMIGSWLWSHAIVIGIVLLILHGVFATGNIIVAKEEYKTLGIILAIIRAIFPPLIIISSYKMTMLSEKEFGANLLFQWLLIFWAITCIECLWCKAFETRGGRWYLKFVGLSLLGIVASIGLVGIIISEGF